MNVGFVVEGSRFAFHEYESGRQDGLPPTPPLTLLPGGGGWPPGGRGMNAIAVPATTNRATGVRRDPVVELV